MQWFWCIIDTLEKKNVKSKLKCESIDNDKKSMPYGVLFLSLELTSTGVSGFLAGPSTTDPS